MKRNGNIQVSEPKTEENQNQVAGSVTPRSTVEPSFYCLFYRLGFLAWKGTL